MRHLILMAISLVLGAPSAFAAIKLNNVQCQFSDQAGTKININMNKRQSILSQGGAQAARPIQKVSLLSKEMSYRAQVKSNKGQNLASKKVPVSLVRIFRQAPRGSNNSMIESMIEVYIPSDSTLKANNPRRKPASFVITTASMVFVNGMATSLKGVCWK